jgi:hypothetical protein
MGTGGEVDLFEINRGDVAYAGVGAKRVAVRDDVVGDDAVLSSSLGVKRAGCKMKIGLPVPPALGTSGVV